MNNRNVLKDNRDEILRIAASHGAQDLSVFGSILRGKATDKSDVDILIKLNPGEVVSRSSQSSRTLKVCLGARLISIWS